jgi:hypothetical protein
MLSLEEKSRIAETCPEYDPSNPIFRANIAGGIQSCDSCSYYTEGKCKKNIMSNIWSEISLN